MDQYGREGDNVDSKTGFSERCRGGKGLNSESAPSPVDEYAPRQQQQLPVAIAVALQKCEIRQLWIHAIHNPQQQPQISSFGTIVLISQEKP